MFTLVGCQNAATEPNLLNVYAECCPQCALSVNMAFPLAFMLFQDNLQYMPGNCV